MENFYFPMKPEFPPGGIELECPHCGHKKKYVFAELFYQG